MTIKIGNKEFPRNRMVRIRTKEGQVIEVIPNVAAAMVNGGTADLVETTSLDPAREQAVAPAQNKTKHKPKK